MGWELKARFAANPPPESGAFKPTANPPKSNWVVWPGVEMGSDVTIAPTWWLASLGLNRENLWKTELKECRVSLRVPRAKIEGALFLDLSSYDLSRGSTDKPTMVYFSDDAEVVYIDLNAARGLGLFLG